MLVFVTKAFSDRRKISYIVGVFKSRESARSYVDEQHEKADGVHYLTEEWPVHE